MTRLKLMFSHLSLQCLAVFFFIGLMVCISNGPWWIWAIMPLGIGAQMLNEYSLHRFVFHLPPPNKQWQFDLLYQAHYGHHDFPTNHALFFVPIWVALPMLVINFCIVFLVMAVIASPYAFVLASAIVLVGGIATFMSYEWFHMTAHLNLPKTWVERHVTTLHNQHHFRDFGKWFHVSPGGQIIDRAMGTAINRDALKSKQRIEFIRTLGMCPDDPKLLAARARFAAKYDLSEKEIMQAARG